MQQRTEPRRLVPSNPLEVGLAQARDGVMSTSAFLRLLLASELAVPSASEVQPGGRGLQPLHFDKAGTTMMAVFSGVDRARVFAGVAPYVLQTTGGALLRALAPEIGIVLNPTYDLGFDISPEGVAAVVRDFG